MKVSCVRSDAASGLWRRPWQIDRTTFCDGASVDVIPVSSVLRRWRWPVRQGSGRAPVDVARSLGLSDTALKNWTVAEQPAGRARRSILMLARLSARNCVGCARRPRITDHGLSVRSCVSPRRGGVSGVRGGRAVSLDEHADLSSDFTVQPPKPDARFVGFAGEQPLFPPRGLDVWRDVGTGLAPALLNCPPKMAVAQQPGSGSSWLAALEQERAQHLFTDRRELPPPSPRALTARSTSQSRTLS